jgi:hypothetical protein
MNVSVFIFNYLYVAFALQYWQTSGTTDARESMTLNGQVLIVAFVAAKGSTFPNADVEAP